MPTFKYSAMAPSGQTVRGVLAGASEQAVMAELESRQLVPVTIETRADGVGGIRIGSGVSARNLGNSYIQLADLLKAGVPLLRSLKLLANRRSKPVLAAIFKELAESVEKGSDLGAAMTNNPKVFPPVHIAMVRAGEKGGFLEEVLSKLGALVLKQAELRGKIIGNLIYPSLLVALGLGVAVIIFTIFIPKFKPMFVNIKGGLPTLTKVVFAMSDVMSTYGLVTAIIVVLLVFGVWWAMRMPASRDWIEKRKTNLPVIGPLVRGFATARLCQLLGTMLNNGVPMLAALKIAKDGTGNLLLSRAVEQAAEAVQAGQHLAPPLGESGLIDDDVLEMIAVGESANNLDEVLLKVGASIEQRLDAMVGTAVRLIEPVLLLVIAGLVGTVAIALLVPMSKLAGSVQ